MDHSRMPLSHSVQPHRMLMWLFFSALPVAMAVACGAAPVAPPPVPVTQVEQAPEPELDRRIFYIFVREIQALTIYPDLPSPFFRTGMAPKRRSRPLSVMPSVWTTCCSG